MFLCSSPRRSKMKRNEWSDSRIIMPFVPLEAIKEEVTPCSSTQRLENNLSVIKNKLRRSGSDVPAHCDQRTQLSGETNTSVANCLMSNRVTNLNYNTRNNLYNIESRMRKSSSRTGSSSDNMTARTGTNVNDARISNIDSSRDASASNDETKIYTGRGNINNTAPAKPARKSVNTSDKNRRNVRAPNENPKPSSAQSRARSLNHKIIASKNSTPRSRKFNSCIDELKYYNVRNGLSKNPSEENSARNLSSQRDDDEVSRSNSGLTTSRTDSTDVSDALFNNKENNSSGNNSTLNDNTKNHSLSVSECNTKDFKYYLMHSDHKTSSTTNSLNLTESEPNSPDTPVDKDMSARVKKHESTRGTANVAKSKSEQEKTRIPKKINTEKVANKNQAKHLPRSELKYKTGVPKNKLNLNDLGCGTKKMVASSNSTKLKNEVKGKESKCSPVNHKVEEICTSPKGQAVENLLKNSTRTKFKHDSSTITKMTADLNDTGDNARKENLTIRRRYSTGESFVTNRDKHKKTIWESPGGQEKTRRTTTFINDNEKRQKDIPPTGRNDDDDCYSKPSDLSLKSSDSLQLLGRQVDCYPSTDGIRDYCTEQQSDNSKVSHRGNILEMSQKNLLMRQIDADDRPVQMGMGDFSEYSLATMDVYCAACNNFSDLSTQDSFSTNTKDTWTQVHFSDIIKEMKMQMKKNKTRAPEEEQEEVGEYSSFLKRQAACDDKKKKGKARSRHTVRNDRTGQYRRGREMNFNYDKPVQNYLINSARQNSSRRFAHDDDTSDCCGCMRFRFFRRIFSRFN